MSDNTPSSSVRIPAARRAVSLMFLINGALFATWVSRIPQVQTRLSLSEGQMGLILLGISAGVLTALAFVGGLVARFGSRRVTTVGALLMTFLLPTLAVISDPIVLWINLFMFGAATSTMDVAMNAQAVRVEQLAQRRFMSGFHAMYSIGGIVGAGFGAFLASQNIPPLTHFLVVVGGFLLLIFIEARDLIYVQPNHSAGKPEPTFRLPSRILIPLGIVAFAGATTEGTAADWSGIYLTNVVGTSEDVAALGFAIFSTMMTAGRLLGDWVTERFSPSHIVRLGGMISAVGLSVIVLMPQTIPVLLGFGAIGLGASVIVPLAFSAAGNMPDISESAAIAGVATIGYAGFLAGPPILGLIAEVTSLRVSFLLIIALNITLLFTASSLRRQKKAALAAADQISA